MKRLTKKNGLAVFASDALSVNSYASENSPGTRGRLCLARRTALTTWCRSLSDRDCAGHRRHQLSQTIFAYPSGGGAYIVPKRKFRNDPGLVAAGCLLVDYVLTVSVFDFRGVAAITQQRREPDGPGSITNKVFLCSR